MSDYGVNFGFRRADETIALREGRLKVPAAGTFKQGDLVARDVANAGFLRAGVNNEPAIVGMTGILIQEEGWDFSIYGESGIVDSYNRSLIRNSRLAQMVSGQGIKLWLRNNAAIVNADRTIAARTVVVVASLIVGDYLTWDGSKYVETATAAFSHAVVTAVSGSGASGYAEAVLLY